MTTFRVEFPDLREFSAQVGEKRMRQAMASSMNNVINKARGVMVQAVQKEYAITAKAVKKRAMIFRQAFPQKLEAQLIGVGSRIPVGRFMRPRQGKTGTAVTIKRGKRTLYPSAFQATVYGRQGAAAGRSTGRKGYTSVWWRVGKKRLKIFEPLGPSVAHMFVDDEVQRETNRYVQRELALDFGNRLITRAKRRIRNARKRIIP